MLAAIRFYDVVVWIHVAAVVLAFGVTFSYPVLVPWLRRHHPRAMPLAHEAQARVGKLLITPAMVVVLASGIYLATDLEVWDETWVSASFLILIVLFGLGGAYFSRREPALAARARRDLDAGGELSPDYERGLVGLSRVGLLASVLILVALFLMVVKPF
jgi:small-conductance mechanosensitive channel